MLREIVANFIAASMPDTIIHILALRKQRDGEELTLADITLEHMSLLESQRLQMLRKFVFAHIALRFPILRAWDVVFVGYADPVIVWI